MNYTYVIALELLISFGFVPNKKNPRYHHAKVTISGYTVYTKDFASAQRIATRVMRTLAKRGINPRYHIEDDFGGYQYNW